MIKVGLKKNSMIWLFLMILGVVIMGFGLPLILYIHQELQVILGIGLFFGGFVLMIISLMTYLNIIND